MYFFTWFFYSYFRPVLKWFLRKTTGLCELQRICYGTVRGALRTKQVETSLNLSRTPEIINLVAHLNELSDAQRFQGPNYATIAEKSVQSVILVKNINPKVSLQFVVGFRQCLEAIWNYKQLMARIEELRTTQYDCENEDHEAKLQSLWGLLMPHEKLESRVTKQWQDIGFQGDDPKTDFRGMGLLGLENLLGFAREYPEASLQVLSHSQHPTYGYAFAIVGINITHLAWTLMKQGEAKTFFYNLEHPQYNLDNFHKFYSYLFYEFDKYWIEAKPKNIMQFSTIKDSFESLIRSALHDPATVFRLNLTTVNTI